MRRYLPECMQISKRTTKYVGFSARLEAAATGIMEGDFMIQRIASLKPLPGYLLSVVLDDGKHVLYDVKEDFALPGYSALRNEAGLFQSVQLDETRTCVY